MDYNCNPSLEYLFEVLKDKNIPFYEKRRLTITLSSSLNLKTPEERAKFILCVVFVLVFLSGLNISGYHALLASLADAIRNGKISKKLGRLIIRKLLRKGLLVDPDLMDAVEIETT